MEVGSSNNYFSSLFFLFSLDVLLMVGYCIDAYILEPHTMVKILESVADVVSESQAVIITRRKGTKEQQRRKYESIQEI